MAKVILESNHRISFTRSSSGRGPLAIGRLYWPPEDPAPTDQANRAPYCS
jgi:hypothetical protein